MVFYRVTRILPGISSRESFPAAIISRLAAGRTSDRLATLGESRITRGNIAGILILSYYLISPVTRTNARTARANWHRYTPPSMFLPPFPDINLHAVGVATNVLDRGVDGSLLSDPFCGFYATGDEIWQDLPR